MYREKTRKSSRQHHIATTTTHNNNVNRGAQCMFLYDITLYYFLLNDNLLLDYC